MTNSQNGWSVLTSSTQLDRGAVIPGISAPNGIRPGDVAVVLRYVARRFDAEVERLIAGDCWGWFDRPVRGSTSISNHASGTALDFNAPAHPLGQVGTFTSKQVAAIKSIISACNGVVRWGGSYSGRKDEMHFEIIGDAGDVKALAAKINSGGTAVSDDVQQAAVNQVSGDILRGASSPQGQSGINKNLVSLITQTAPSIVYGDMARGPGSAAGQSGLNLLVQNTIASAVAPIASRLAAAEAEIAALKAAAK